MSLPTIEANLEKAIATRRELGLPVFEGEVVERRVCPRCFMQLVLIKGTVRPELLCGRPIKFGGMPPDAIPLSGGEMTECPHE